MDLSGILSIAGHPGLFKLVSQMKGGLIVESLTDGRRMPAYATQKILSLDDIAIYTDGDDVPLKQIYDSIIDRTGGKVSIDTKTATIEELRDHLAQVLPNFDRERVYASDVKKVFQWYNILAEHGLAIKESPAKETTEKEGAGGRASAEEGTLKAATAKASSQKTAAPKAKVPTSKAKTGATVQRKAGKA
jgi:hypothetical protein